MSVIAAQLTRMFRAQGLSLWVRPQVLLGAGHIQRPRSNKSEEHVLVDRQFIFPIVEISEVIAEPVWEAGVDPGNGLAKSKYRTNKDRYR